MFGYRIFNVILFGLMGWVLLSMIIIMGASAAYEADSFTEVISIEYEEDPSEVPAELESELQSDPQSHPWANAIAEPIAKAGVGIVALVAGVFYPISLVVPAAIMRPVLSFLPFLPLLVLGYYLYKHRSPRRSEWRASD